MFKNLRNFHFGYIASTGKEISGDSQVMKLVNFGNPKTSCQVIFYSKLAEMYPAQARKYQDVVECENPKVIKNNIDYINSYPVLLLNDDEINDFICSMPEVEKKVEIFEYTVQNISNLFLILPQKDIITGLFDTVRSVLAENFSVFIEQVQKTIGCDNKEFQNFLMNMNLDSSKDEETEDLKEENSSQKNDEKHLCDLTKANKRISKKKSIIKYLKEQIEELEKNELVMEEKIKKQRRTMKKHSLRKAELDLKEAELNEKENKLSAKEAELNAKEAALNAKEAELNAKETELGKAGGKFREKKMRLAEVNAGLREEVKGLKKEMARANEQLLALSTVGNDERSDAAIEILQSMLVAAQMKIKANSRASLFLKNEELERKYKELLKKYNKLTE